MSIGSMGPQYWQPLWPFGAGQEPRLAPKKTHWVALKGLNLSYHNSHTTLFTVYPYYDGNLD